ncbi:MAG: hypothetical protein JXB36_14790 [Gammaproteobacteria bacterium]|nr:hypothetical protein [Gammaproteobacteria bacterium]
MKKAFGTIGPSTGAVVAAVLWLAAQAASAQFGQAPEPAGSPRDAAPIDLTGQWVSIVTEDWRFRMVTAPKGDYPGVELNAAGRELADSWDPARDEAEGEECKAYGAGGIMRMPGRIRVSWRDAATLEIETDAGRQTRVFHFSEVPGAGEPTRQGVSRAEWIAHGGGRGQAVVNGSLKVVTTGMKPGYLRKNGVPYSGEAVITEYFDLLEHPDGSEWLVVKTIVEDPEYLAVPYIVSSNFRKEEDRRGWAPRPCSAR